MEPWLRLALAGLCAALAARHAEAACYGSPITLSSYSSFQYAAAYSSSGGCDLNSVRTSRLYMYGACISSRNNNFGTSLPGCDSYGSVTNFTTETCEAVFAHGPSNAFISSPNINQIFDEEAICNPGTQGFFFAETTCTTFANANLQVEVQGYRGGYCWYSGSLSGGAIAGVVIGSLIIFGLLCWCCFILVRRTRGPRAPATVQMQPYGVHGAPYPGGPAPYSDGHPVGAPGTYAGPSSYPAAASNPFEDKGGSIAEGIPVTGQSSSYQRF